MPRQVSEMSPRERWLAAVKMQPVDRLPFWPKLDGAYPRAQAAPFDGMNIGEIHDWIGSDKHEWIPECVKEVRKHTTFESTQTNGTHRQVYGTRHGSMELIQKFDEPSQAWHPVRFPIETIEDIKLMTQWHDDCELELDPDGLEKARARDQEIGDSAITYDCIDESPLMRFVEWLAGVENAHLLLADHRNEVEALFDAMHRSVLRKTQILCEHSPADVHYFIENTSTTLISPEQYRRYCFEHIKAYGAIAEEHGRLIVLHMCGHLKKILPDLAKLPVAAFEAFTAPTLGNTTLLDGRTACPDKCLIGGTNAMLWLRLPGEITAQIEADLDVLPHHRGIVVTSAGVMPPWARPETIKAVCEWVKRYDARM